MTKYRLYVDEVGDTGLRYVDDPAHRYLSLTGVIAEPDYDLRQIAFDMIGIKGKYFDITPEKSEALHRTKLVRAKRPFGALKRLEVREAFDAELLARFRDWDYRVITVCLDKQAFVAAGLDSGGKDPYLHCMTVLMERYVDMLMRYSDQGDVMVEARLGKEDRLLKEHFRSLWEGGTEVVSGERFQTALLSREIKPQTKQKNISGLQLADLLAHPSRIEILREHGLPCEFLGGYATKVVEILADKYVQFDGHMYGKNLMP